METPVVQNSTKVATKWAVIYTLTAIVITYAFQFLNVDQNSGFKYLNFVPFIAFLIMAQKEYRDVLGGYISFGNAFSAGFRFSVFAGILVALFTLLYYSILSPQMYQKMLDTIQTAMEEKNMQSDMVEKTMNFYRGYGKIMFPFLSAIGSAIMGAIIALIGAAIFKKERSPYDIAQSAVDPTAEV